ncbi:FtsW/RodA/SpoVE family cell cycle protein [Solibacillus cecembensis]|uniref:FtsW/RodA/SpoVE family cell cycle protein n=1 Tax=Solibacillus cecembensis TaxID=459347 RepID=UPI003D0585BD
MQKIHYLSFITFPAILLGAIIMYINDIPKSIWLQNIIVTILFILLSFLMFKKKKINPNTKGKLYLPVVTIMILLLLTFLDSGVEGVHRWLTLGPISINISNVFLPLLLILLSTLLSKNQWWKSYLIVLTTSFLLVLQPDASTVTAFVISTLVLFVCNINRYSIRFTLLLIPLTFVIISWIFIDSLAPVPYVEDILFMAKDLGFLWFIIALTSLFILIIPFLFFPPKKQKITSISLGIYFLTLLITTFFGHFPVILMGYGISPIIGYFISINWLIQSKQEEHSKVL